MNRHSYIYQLLQPYSWSMPIHCLLLTGDWCTHVSQLLWSSKLLRLSHLFRTLFKENLQVLYRRYFYRQLTPVTDQQQGVSL